MILIIVSVLLSVISGVLLYLKWINTFWKRHEIPGPEPSLFVGNISQGLRMKRHVGTLIDEWYKKYSDYPYFGYYRSITPVLVVRDPDLIREVILTNQAHFNKNDFGFNEKLDPLFAHNPFFASGDTWKVARQYLSPLFSIGKIKVIFPLMMETCKKLENHLMQKGPKCDFDAKDLGARFTTDNVANCAYSLDAESFTNKNSEFRIMGKAIFQPTTWRALRFIFLMYIPPLTKIFPVKFLPPKVDVWFRRFIKTIIDAREKQRPTHEDLLQMLLGIRERNSLDETQVAGHSLSFFVEGYETSSSLLCNAMYEMGKNPDIQQRLHDEIIEVLSSHDGQLTFEAINEMSYLECVLFEALRLHPIGFTMNKVCTKPYTFPPLPGHKSGFEIQKGMSVVISVYSLHHDPIYFPEPDVYDPERFTEDNRKNRHKHVYIPFGDGPRMCTGMKFALMQNKAALATIVKSFKITVSPNCKPFDLNPKSSLYQSKEPLLLNFEPR